MYARPSASSRLAPLPLLLAAFALACAAPCFAQSSPEPTTTQQPAAEPDKQQVDPPQTPAESANLPNSPGSIISAKPHGDHSTPLQDVPHPEVKLRDLPLNIVGDQVRIFTSPLYIRPQDLKWMLPIAGAAALTFATDTKVGRDVVSHNSSFNNTAANLSDAVRDGFIGIPVIFVPMGEITRDKHISETGQLASEAMVDAYIVDAVVKVASFRERPNVDNARGNFYQTSAGYDSSFISGHAMVSWSSAAVLAAEYPKIWQQTLIYTAASSVSIDRVLALEHFPTDVLLGSAAGWLIGHYVARAHHHHPIYRHHKDQPDTF